MRVEIFTASDARELTRELNAVLEGYNNEEVEIQYQHCARFKNTMGETDRSLSILKSVT